MFQPHDVVESVSLKVGRMAAVSPLLPKELRRLTLCYPKLESLTRKCAYRITPTSTLSTGVLQKKCRGGTAHDSPQASAATWRWRKVR